jgi:hypothetical protein
MGTPVGESRETERFVFFSNDPDNRPVSKWIVIRHGF